MDDHLLQKVQRRTNADHSVIVDTVLANRKPIGFAVVRASRRSPWDRPCRVTFFSRWNTVSLVYLWYKSRERTQRRRLRCLPCTLSKDSLHHICSSLVDIDHTLYILVFGCCQPLSQSTTSVVVLTSPPSTIEVYLLPTENEEKHWTESCRSLGRTYVQVRYL